jgi:hypothetical protein
MVAKTTVRSLTTALALLLATTGVAGAADYCLDVSSLPLVLKAFKLPAKGKCGEARGFYLDGPAFVHGSACRNTQNSTATFLLTAAFAENREISSFTLDLAAGTGSGLFCQVDTGSGGACSTFSVAKVPCVPTVIPVP